MQHHNCEQYILHTLVLIRMLMPEVDDYLQEAVVHFNLQFDGFLLSAITCLLAEHEVL